jgi:phosphoglucosamine mutase
MSRLFGTDGVRGVANRELTPDLALALGRAAGSVLAPGGGDVVVGRDTRLSGPMLEGALVAGLCSAGVDARLAGVITSPGVSWLTVDARARAGAMISASHNPIADNGIKFFSPQGAKIAGEAEDAIQDRMRASPADVLAVGAGVGTATSLPDASDRYVAHLVSTLDGSLGGLRVVLDCAYGAAWEVGPRAFTEAGAEVVAMHAEPDGARINVDCGSTSMGQISERVVAEGAHLGLAFDGDADRVLAVDERGKIVDGDRILGLCALEMRAAGRLRHDLVVTTVMSNLGLQRALEARGIAVLTAPVGDKYVAEAMSEHAAVLGGEQSGHIIFSNHSLTGDGILTGLQVAGIVVSSEHSLHELAHFYEPYPQVLINVPVASKDDLATADELWKEVGAAETELGEGGRVLLRASGTEPLVRVMVEAADGDRARALACELADAVTRHLA